MGNRFVSRMGDLEPSQCNRCAHLRPGGSCTAYPDGIPFAVRLNEVDHRKPYLGDGGIQWTPFAIYSEHPLGEQ